MVKRSTIVLLFLVPVAVIVTLVVARHQRRLEGTRELLQAGIDRNREVANISSNRWGRELLFLSTPGAREEFGLHVKVDNPLGLDDEAVVKCRREIWRLLEAYSQGSFEALREYYIVSNSRLNAQMIMSKVEHFRENPPKSTLISRPVFNRAKRHSAASQAELVGYDSTWDAVLREYYRDMLAYTSLNELAAQSHAQISSEQLKRMSGEELAAYMDAAVSNLCVEIESSADLTKFTYPWEAVSRELCQITFTMEREPLEEVWRRNANQLGGPQMDKPIWCVYEPSVAQLVAGNGQAPFAILETAVKVKGLPYVGPVTIAFYMDPETKEWRVCRFACHAQISPSVPL